MKQGETDTSTYATLRAVDVNSKIEKKGNLDYLSWANAWHFLKINYPTAQRLVYEDPETGWNYYSDGRTAWVKVGVEVNGIEHIDYLPVMDHRNKAIPIDNVTSTAVNKTIQRSTAKAIAMHGLGLSLWIGEDLPEAEHRLPDLNPKHEKWSGAVQALADSAATIPAIKKKYNLSPTNEKLLIDEAARI